MQNDYVLTTNDDGDLAIRTVSATENENVTDTTSVITRTDDGKLAVRVVGNGGGSDQHSLGYFTTLAELQDAYPTAAAGDWAIVAESDTVYIWDDAQQAWVDTDRRGQVSSVNGQTGAVELTAADVGAATAAQGEKADTAIQSVKTINGQPIVGTGNIDIDSLPSQTDNAGKVLSTDGVAAFWGTPTTITFREWGANE